jgi:hypothetical protein
MEWYQSAQHAVRQMQELLAKEETSQQLGRKSAKAASRRGSSWKFSASTSGGVQRNGTSVNGFVCIPSKHHQLAAHTYVQLIGRNILHRAWVILAVIRGLHQPPAGSVIRDMILHPFLACVEEALEEFLSAPTENLPAFVVGIQQDPTARKFRRLLDSQFTHGGTTFQHTRHYSALRILSCIYNDCTDFPTCMDNLLLQMLCEYPRLCTPVVKFLDHEFYKRAREIQSLISGYVQNTVWV